MDVTEMTSVERSFAAHNRSTPAHMLEQLADDTVTRGYVAAVAQHPNTPVHLCWNSSPKTRNRNVRACVSPRILSTLRPTCWNASHGTTRTGEVRKGVATLGTTGHARHMCWNGADDTDVNTMSDRDLVRRFPGTRTHPPT